MSEHPSREGCAPQPQPRPAVTVMLIHGMHCRGEHWAEFAERLEAGGVHTLAPTLRHHDEVPAPRSLGKLRLEDYCDDLAELARSVEGFLVLCGHSMGGLIALKLLERGIGHAAILLAPAAPANVIGGAAPAAFSQLILFARHLDE